MTTEEKYRAHLRWIVDRLVSMQTELEAIKKQLGHHAAYPVKCSVAQTWLDEGKSLAHTERDILGILLDLSK